MRLSTRSVGTRFGRKAKSTRSCSRTPGTSGSRIHGTWQITKRSGWARLKRSISRSTEGIASRNRSASSGRISEKSGPISSSTNGSGGPPTPGWNRCVNSPELPVARKIISSASSRCASATARLRASITRTKWFVREHMGSGQPRNAIKIYTTFISKQNF